MAKVIIFCTYFPHLSVDVFYVFRFAYHLKLRALEGKGIRPHQLKNHNNEKVYPIRVVCQPAGRTEKVNYMCIPFFFRRV